MIALDAAFLKKAIFPFLAAVFCLSFSTAWAETAISTPILPSAPNFRDLAGISAKYGGTGFVNPTSKSGVMRTGVIYRTDELAYLNGADSAVITSLGINRDIDLRTPSEINASPDRVPQGVAYQNINIYGTYSPIPDPPFTASPATAAAFMQAGYRAFVTDPLQRAALRDVLLTLANDANPAMYHCSGGKDRTGWTSALLQSIAGVAPETIMRDYLATNRYTAALIGAVRAGILAQNPGANPATVDALLGVQAGYLHAAFDQVIASYGSMQAYLTQGLGLTQADIYVLRGKMVFYTILPGQNGFTGNAASGASFLKALQDSPLSGRYTGYNCYLQSAIDAGALGSVPERVGGQVHADAAACLLRQSQRIDAAIKPFIGGRGLRNGQTRGWVAGMGSEFRTDGHDGIAESREESAGTLLGAIRRYSDQFSLSGGLGYNYGSVESSEATVTTNTVLLTLGGRYGFSSLESGFFLEGRVDAGWVNYHSGRELGSGLGNASGKTNGAVYSGQAQLGYAFGLAPFTLTPRAGVRLTGLYLPGYDESGSDLALNVHRFDEMSTSLLAGLDIDLDPQVLGGWTVTPAMTLGYERILNDPQMETTGDIHGFSISQKSAFDSRDLLTAGLMLRAEHGGFTFTGMVDGVAGDDAQSAGIGGQLSVAYNF